MDEYLDVGPARGALYVGAGALVLMAGGIMALTLLDPSPIGFAVAGFALLVAGWLFVRARRATPYLRMSHAGIRFPVAAASDADQQFDDDHSVPIPWSAVEVLALRSAGMGAQELVVYAPSVRPGAPFVISTAGVSRAWLQKAVAELSPSPISVS